MQAATIAVFGDVDVRNFGEVLTPNIVRHALR